MMEKLSNCCGATFIGETDLCSECNDHAGGEIIFGKTGDIIIDADLDCDGELSINIESSNCTDWLTKDDSVDMIKHLSEVFGLDVILEAVEKFEENNRGEK